MTIDEQPGSEAEESPRNAARAYIPLISNAISGCRKWFAVSTEERQRK